MASSGEGEKKGGWRRPWKRNSIKKSGEYKKSGTAAGDERAEPPSLTETYPKTSQETRQPDRRSKKGKKGSSSSRASAGSIESPPPSCARRSLVLESSDAAPATVGREGGGKPGSSPSGVGETVFAEDSRQEGTVGEYLFNDDPHREKAEAQSVTADEVKGKLLDGPSPESQLQLIEQELREREKEPCRGSSENSVPDRLKSLLGAYDDRHKGRLAEMETQKSEFARMTKFHEKAGRNLEEQLRKEHEAKVEETRLKHEQEIASVRAESQASENRWEEEMKRMVQEHSLEVEELKAGIEAAGKTHQEEEEKLNSEHARKLLELSDEVEQLRAKLEEKQDGLLQVSLELDQLRQKHQQLENERKEEVKAETEGALDKDQHVAAAEGANHKFTCEVAELQRKCSEQQAKITELEQAVAAGESKLHGQEKISKSNETMMKKLEHQLEAETKTRAAVEQQLQVAKTGADEKEHNKNHELGTKLTKKEEELEELQQNLHTVREQLREQEAKREESQRQLESFQKAMKTETSTAKSAAYLEQYFDEVTKLCEEMTDWKKRAEDRERDADKLRKLVERAETMEQAYVEATKRLSEAEAEMKALRVQIPAERCEQGSQTGATGTAGQPGLHTDSQTSQSLKRLRKEVQVLKDKLQARDDELRELKSKEGNTPFANPLASPTDSVAADTSEVASLRLQLKERETELQNFQVQVRSMERNLKEREELKKTSDSLRSEVAKLSHDKQVIQDYSKQQSEKILTLRTELEKRPEMVQPTVVTQTGEVEQWRAKAESADHELQNMEARMEELTKELDESRKECRRNMAAFDVANEQAQIRQQKLNEDVKKLKEKAEQMKTHYTGIYEEKKNLKQIAEELKKLLAEDKDTLQEVEKEVERLREESHQKDLVMQECVEQNSSSLQQLKEKLAAAEAKCQELEECNQDVLCSQQEVIQERLQEKSEEMERLKEEVKAKAAQVTQYKKKLQEKQPTKPTDEIETLQIELATSRSSLEDTEQRLKEISLKHAEMEKQYSKKFQELEKQLQQTRVQNQRLEGLVRESETRQRLEQKRKELELTQAQQHQAEMASELTRLQKDRNREDEFSKAFQEEFQAHQAMKARCGELQSQLDTALDSLDGLRLKKEVLIKTLVDQGMELPFVEPQPLALADMPQSTTQMPQEQWTSQPHVAISQKPIASPGVFNQCVDQASYMPPHSNAESQYLEQQAEQRLSNWQQQQQQQHVYPQPGIERGAPTVSQGPRGALAVPSTRQAATYETDAVVGLPASAVSRPITPRRQQPSLTSQWPLQSRHSDSEIQSGRTVPGQPLANYPTLTPSVQPLNVPPAMIQPPMCQPPMTQPPMCQPPMTQPPMCQPPMTQPPMCQPPMDQPAETQQLAAMTQPAMTQPPMCQPPMGQPAMGQPAMGQPAMGQPAIGQPAMCQPPMGQPAMGQPAMTQPAVGQPVVLQNVQQSQLNVRMGHQPALSAAGQVQMMNRGDPQLHNVGQPHQPHQIMGQQQPHNSGQPGHQGVNLPPACQPQHFQLPNVHPPQPRYDQALQFGGQNPAYLQQKDFASTQVPHGPPVSATPYAPHQPPTAPPEFNNTPDPILQDAAPGHGSRFQQAEFVKPVPETSSVVPSEPCTGVPRSTKLAAGSEIKTPPKPGVPASVASRKDSDAKDGLGLMENLTGTIQETFAEVNTDEPTGSIDSGLQSIPPDPNLECVLCGKVFKIGQIQSFKRHSENCTGSRSS